MDEEPSGCGNPLGGWGRIIAQCYLAMLLVVPFMRRGPTATRGQTSCPPLIRMVMSPIPGGHGLVRGFSHVFVTCGQGRGTSGLAATGVRHDVDGGRGYEIDGVVTGRERVGRGTNQKLNEYEIKSQ